VITKEKIITVLLVFPIHSCTWMVSYSIRYYDLRFWRVASWTVSCLSTLESRSHVHSWW